ncbi:hypothetical protein V8E36_005123 [Tilletia maclaganii]
MAAAGPSSAGVGVGASASSSTAAAAAAADAGADKPYERTIFSYDPIDEFTATIADWIFFRTQGLANVEIEAKIGTLVDNSTGSRLFMPVLTETVLLENTEGIRFVSQIAMPHHSAMNKLLNQLVTYTNTKHYAGTKINYQRLTEIDYFHKLEPSKLPADVAEGLAKQAQIVEQQGQAPLRDDKIRVTRDKNGKAKGDQAIVKRRIASLEVFCPKRAYDYRISINTETPVPLSAADSDAIFWRDKNRITYKHELVQVDVTLVASTNPSKGVETTHEVELEFLDSVKLLAAAHEARGEGPTQDWTPYDDMCHIFLNNIRMLIRNMPELPL